MNIDLVAIVRQKLRVSGGSHVRFTSVDLVYPDGRDCGVPLFVKGYDEASELLMKFGVTVQELEEHRRHFDKDAEVSIPLVADEAVVRGEGFNPRTA